jgi:hypothetical protein
MKEMDYYRLFISIILGALLTKFKEENGGFLSERWYHLSPIENTVKVFYWRYQLDKCGLPIGRTWETVVLNLEE